MMRDRYEEMASEALSTANQFPADTPGRDDWWEQAATWLSMAKRLP